MKDEMELVDVSDDVTEVKKDNTIIYVAGAFAGIAYLAFATAKPMKKHNMKKHASKMMQSAECLFNDLKSFI